MKMSEKTPSGTFKFDENVRKYSKLVESTVGKGEIARYEQFLLCPRVFSKRLDMQTGKNQGLFGKWLSKRQNSRRVKI